MKNIKKISALLLLITLTMSIFTGCSEKSSYAKKQEGTYVADTFEIDAPEGWMRNERYANQVIFCTKDYPDDTKSYISVGWTDEAQLDVLRDYKDSIISNILNSLEEQLGENCGAAVNVYEDTEVNGFDCVHMVTAYTNEGMAFTQDSYTFDSSTGSVTLQMVRAGGNEFAEAFDNTLNSIVIK
ncbi:MAG: hypothetical protein Q4C42_00185 [Clostridia bacterium]|nr:hypothetical protein [Clostridia bacterium]